MLDRVRSDDTRFSEGSSPESEGWVEISEIHTDFACCMTSSSWGGTNASSVTYASQRMMRRSSELEFIYMEITSQDKLKRTHLSLIWSLVSKVFWTIHSLNKRAETVIAEKVWKTFSQRFGSIDCQSPYEFSYRQKWYRPRTDQLQLLSKQATDSWTEDL